MTTILTIPQTTKVYDFWDATIPLTENKISEVGFKVSSGLIQVQVPEDEVEKALEILSENINVEN